MNKVKDVEMPGFEPGASYMRSKRSTTELHPRYTNVDRKYEPVNKTVVIDVRCF